MFQLANPSVLYLLALVPVMIFVVLRSWKRLSRKLKGMDKRIFSILTSSISKEKRAWKLAFQMLTLIFLVLSLARPRLGEALEEVKVKGIEIVFVVDVSRSMQAEDVKPNRLSLAKKTLNRIMDRIGGHRVGLVAFAGSPILLSPLTTDYSAIRMYLGSLSVDSVSSQGTNFKDAMVVAHEAFKRGGVDADEKTQVTRVILFLSDGEDNEVGALKEAESLTSQGTHIFAMGVGTKKGAPIPHRDERGNLKGYKKDKSHNVVLSKVNTEFLEKLAQMGKGGYYHATFAGEEVRRIEADLGRLEQTDFEAERMRNYDEKYQWPLFFAFIFGLLELILGERKKTFDLKRKLHT